MPDPIPLSRVDITTAGGMITASMLRAHMTGGNLRAITCLMTQDANLVTALQNGDAILPQGRYAIGTAPTLSPSTIAATGTPTNITITGTGFTAKSQAFVNGSPVATTYLSATQVRITITPTPAGSRTIMVRTGQVETAAATFTIT